MEGKIKVMNSSGYGFISTKNKIDFFFHHSSFDGDWKALLSRYLRDEEILVQFDNDTTANDGPRAINVRLKEGDTTNA